MSSSDLVAIQSLEVSRTPSSLIGRGLNQVLANSQSLYDKGVAAYKSGEYTTALNCFTILAAENHTDAQFKLAMMHELGDGIYPDWDAAIGWYKKAGEMEHAESLFRVGFYYEFHHKPYNSREASIWYQAAANVEHAGAIWRLALLYDRGHGVPKSAFISNKLTIRAAELGHPHAISYLKNFVKQI